MAGLETNVRYIKGIGEQRAKSLEKLGIGTLQELVSYFPRSYEDRSRATAIGELQCGDFALVIAKVGTQPQSRSIRSGLNLVSFRIFDATGSMSIVIFNQPYLAKSIVQGDSYAFFGKISEGMRSLEMTNPIVERERDFGRLTGRIVPIYRLTAGVSAKLMINAVEAGIAACGDVMPDPLPENVRRAHKLAQSGFAYHNIHFPDSMESLALARRRLIFEELYVLAAALGYIKGRRAESSGITMRMLDDSAFCASLPYELTGAQRRVIEQAKSDMCSGRGMNRLVQGDVGSGKTAVAAACAYFAHINGWQTAFMAPTEILAEQHYENLSAMLSPLGVKTVLLKGGMRAAEKRASLSAIASGEAGLVIGTHALLSENVEFARLGLAITDEQHRFGVNQRMTLAHKGESPHVMVMSATPIPRTLALMLYGDLDVSVIDELPPGRQRIATYAVDESMRSRINDFIRRLVDEGRQVYIVCPMVEENENYAAELKSVKEYTAKLRDEIFPNLSVGFVHGKMKSAEKEQIMSRFAAGELDILVCTTVIEVGVDVPNAALIVIENAERFGLSQLHQLRGRVGRGRHKSYCVMFSDNKTDDTRARLAIMTQTNDGFRISEEDLKIRGPGDFFGSRQHGLPEFRIANLNYDLDILTEAQSAAQDTLAADPELRLPENAKLYAHIRRIFAANNDIF